MLCFVVLSAHDVEVEEGEDSVKLPFQTTGDLPADVQVSWRCFIGNGEDILNIFVYKNGEETRHDAYRERIRMENDMLRTGNLSLTLMNPRDEDMQTYRCIVKNKGGYFIRLKTVKLKRRSRNKDTGQTSLSLSMEGCLFVSIWLFCFCFVFFLVVCQFSRFLLVDCVWLCLIGCLSLVFCNWLFFSVWLCLVVCLSHF